MELREWITSFKVLHERARKGDLSGDERSAYLGQRKELATAMCSAQRLMAPPGQPPRQAMRIAQVFEIDLELADGRQQLMTMNVSTGGFAAPLTKVPDKAAAIPFSMRLPGDGQQIQGKVRVVNVQTRPKSALVSFSFLDLIPADLERLELVLFDAVIKEFSRF